MKSMFKALASCDDPQKGRTLWLEALQKLLDKPGRDDDEARIALAFLRDSLLNGTLVLRRRRHRGPRDSALVAEFTRNPSYDLAMRSPEYAARLRKLTNG